MTRSHLLIHAATAAAILAGCLDPGAEPDSGTRAAADLIPIEIPLDPFLACAWNHPLPWNQNIGYTGYGYWGDERGFRIHYGNYNSAGGYLEYKIEVIWSLPGCAGTVYYLRFPDHGLTNHAEVEVRGQAQALKGRIAATEGSLPVLYNQANAALPTHKRGPFVITTSMVGAGAGAMADTIVFTLLDAHTLARLPPPVFYDGALPGSLGQEAVIATAYDELVEDNEYLYTFFTFRLALEAMTQADRQATFDSVDVLNDITGLVHGDPLWLEHHHINHLVAVETPDIANDTYGGFFNGHRNFMRLVEAVLPDEAVVPAFQRLPSWDPATTVPAEFAEGIDPALFAANGNLSGGSDLETAYKAANVCANFDSSLSAEATHAARMTDMEEALWSDVNPWHGSVHTGLGGDMVSFDTTAGVPLFWLWHTTVDVIWQNWQLCEGAYYPNRYHWDAL